MVELGSRRTTERVRVGNSPPTAARAVFLPDDKRWHTHPTKPATWKSGCSKSRAERPSVGRPTATRVTSILAGLRTCSGRQGHSPVGASPTVPVARIRHVAIPQLLGVIPGSLRGVNGPAALRTRAAAVGAIGGPSKHGSLNITECLQPRETSPVEVALQGLNFVSRTCHLEREADASQEGTGERTGRSRRGTGPSAYARIMEITSGSTVFQQEARSNLQRLAVYAKAKPARGFRWGA